MGDERCTTLSSYHKERETAVDGSLARFLERTLPIANRSGNETGRAWRSWRCSPEKAEAKESRPV